ncbi:MAG: VTT domain-containing protein [Chloroflexi bacterium]|nr:VTT domain-containing protein [Chloroflexota bacterium]
MQDQNPQSDSSATLDESSSPKRSNRLFQILALLFAVGITVGLSLLPVDWRHLDWERLKPYGYVGVFLLTLLSDATVIVPFPGLAGVFVTGSFLNPILIGIFGGIGSALGELTGYLAGYGGRAVIENRATYAKLERWMQRNGTLTVFFLSVIPNPLFDMAGITAGMLKFPLWRFLVACWLGKAIKFTAIAFAGAASWDFVFQFLQR